MQNYLDLLKKICETGEPHQDRTGVGTTCLFGESLIFDLQDGRAFPLVTTKRVPFRMIFYELMWFLSGSSDIRDLWEHEVHIWDGNYDAHYWQSSPHFKEFSVGRNYGQQWRCWNGGTIIGVDQIQTLLEGLRNDPQSRRHVVTAWNPFELRRTALPPCHIMFQVKIHGDDSLSLALFIRSSDAFLGLPFNIASYALLTVFLARTLGRKAHRLTVFLGDVHVYNTHRHAVAAQLTRTPYQLPGLQVLPRTVMKDDYVAALLSFTFRECVLTDYSSYPRLIAPLAV